MKVSSRALAVIAGMLLIVGLGATSASAAKKATTPGLPVQLALGDSWAAGVGADPRATEGYVPQLNDALVERYDCSPSRSDRPKPGCKQLQLVNIGVGGATTPTLIANQLPTAEDILARNLDRNPRNNVEVVTVHIGGNDVFNPIIAVCLGGLTPTCVATIQSELAQYQSDLQTALSRLRAAGGPDTTIVIGTYDNPIPTCQLGGVPGAPQLGALVLEGGGPIPAGLNDIMRSVGAANGVQVADVFGDLEPGDWVGGSDCLHPDNSGYDKVTASFLETLGL